MNEQNSIILSLLSKGLLIHTGEIDIHKINKKIRSLGYEAVQFPNRNVIVLKSSADPKGQQIPWKEREIQEIKEIFVTIAMQGWLREESKVIEMLLESFYLKKIGEKLYFTERALVEFEDFIADLNGKFGKCELCGFLGDEGNYHKECEERYKKRLNNREEAP
ncbi:hypothetical protein GINT2_002221 [Glugoides intestinalis]